MRRVNSQPRRWALSIGPCALIAVSVAACGKKGPPLAPIVHIPAAIEQIDARRTGDEVAVTVTVPSKNIDGTIPVDIGRIEVYGYTGTAAPPRGRFLEVATLVGTVTHRSATSRRAGDGCDGEARRTLPRRPGNDRRVPRLPKRSWRSRSLRHQRRADHGCPFPSQPSHPFNLSPDRSGGSTLLWRSVRVVVPVHPASSPNCA